MPDTNKLQSQFYITLGGAPATANFMRDLEEVTVESSLHLPDVATLVLHDPRLHWIDDASLEPGKPLKIAAKSGTSEEPLFDGEIVEIEPDFEPETQRLVVRAFDRLHRLMRGRQVRSFVNVTDGDLVQKLAQEVGLRAQVGPTSQVHPYVLQANETNLALLQRRAAALGYLLFVEGETLHCGPPESSGAPLELKWGSTLSEFHPRMTTIGQVNSVTARGWDPAAKQAITGEARNGKQVPQVGGPTQGGEVAKKAFNLEAHYLVANGPIRTQAAADLLAQATADRLSGRFIEAEGTGSGMPGLIAGVQVKISSVGTRFSGTYFVTGTTHIYHVDEGYRTHFTVSGLHPSTLLGMLAPEPETTLANALVIGIVTDNQDPEHLGRVKVKYPWLSNEHTSDWARVVAVGGGKERGIQFLPEINDEVLIGFELGDIQYAYVLGGLWNGQDALPNDQAASGGKVQQRIIRSRTGHEIILDDADGGGGITIIDQAKNVITLDSQGSSVTIESKGDLTLKARGNLTMESQTGQVAIKGMGVEVNGQAGTVNVRGSMINLN